MRTLILLTILLFLPPPAHSGEIVIPTPPVMEARQIVVNCHAKLAGTVAPNACVMLLLQDWLEMVRWIDQIEKELKIACLRSGKSGEYCQTDSRPEFSGFTVRKNDP